MNLSACKPRIPKSLLMDLAVNKNINRYNENVYLLYNPDGYGGIISVGQQVVDLIQHFDGDTTIESAILKSGLKGKDALNAFNFVSFLIEKDFLIADDFSKADRECNWKKELTCWLHITNDCNLRCTYCYIHKTHSNMPNCTIYQSIDKMLASCKKHGYSSLSLMIVGGEPLMRFSVVKEIVAYCEANKGNIQIKYIIPSNGTLISPEVAKYIVQKHISVGVSIDGVEQFHDANRVRADGKGSYHDSMRGIDNLIAEGFKPSIMVTVTKENLEGLPELTKLLISKKIFFRFSFERDTQSGHPSILLDESHCINVLKQCFDIMKISLLNGELGWRFQFGDVTFGRPCRRACAAGKNFFAIGQDGTIGSCSLGLENPKANIANITDVISEIPEIFHDLSSTSACDISECRACVWRHSCAGACPLQTYATYGTFLHASPYCKIYQACLPEVTRIYAMTIYFNNKEKEG